MPRNFLACLLRYRSFHQVLYAAKMHPAGELTTFFQTHSQLWVYYLPISTPFTPVASRFRRLRSTEPRPLNSQYWGRIGATAGTHDRIVLCFVELRLISDVSKTTAVTKVVFFETDTVIYFQVCPRGASRPRTRVHITVLNLLL